ncbi:hypothetical protein ACH5RR_023990 [Cinchona calisaya]|uniref:DUF4378 domain-containing protein n=1 Tax=Cinchona calisaya TaxID=153742 RepID=A0ABD2ZDD3_9GENT
MAASPRFASYSCERRPRLLKDFLTEEYSVPSCSSNGFISPTKLLRNGSKNKAASISEKIIKAIKFLPFASMVKSHYSIIPRSISRKLSRSKDHKDGKSTISSGDEFSSPAVVPKIKDILRWKSFRDVVEEISTNWYERDFAAEEDLLPSWGGEINNNDFMGHKKMEGQLAFDENEQNSPVSVLDNSPFRDDEGSISLFNPTVGTILERRKCILRIQEFENLAKRETFIENEGFASKEKSTAKEDEETNVVEAKAWQLLSHIKATTPTAKYFEANYTEKVLLDFFRHELAIITTNKKQKDVELLALAKSWMSREYCEGSIFDCELLENAEASVRDMEIGLRWDKFNEEQEELVRQLEIYFLNDLLDELLADLVL